MLIKNVRFRQSIHWIIDIALLAGVFAAAVWVRFYAGLIPHSGIPAAGQSLQQGAMAVFFVAASLRIQGVYRRHMSDIRLGHRLVSLFRGVAAGGIALLAATYVFVDVRYSRAGLLLFLGAAFVALSLVRVVRRQRALRRLRQGKGDRALIVGSGKLAELLVHELASHGALSVQPVGLLTRREAKLGTRVAGIDVVGMYDDLAAQVAALRATHVFFALPHDATDSLAPLLERMVGIEAVDVHVVPDLTQWTLLGGGVYALDTLPVVSLQDSPMGGWDAFGKRVFDLALGLPLMAIAAPIIATFAMLVRLDSKGGMFYGQERVGLDGKPFKMWKIRSMRPDSEVAGARWATANDDRTTPVGKFMRKYSVDELPQLWNVVRGDMSLVGPRPERPVFIEKFKHEIPNYNLRHKVKAGVTGLAQVEGWRGDTSLEKRIERDLWYIEHWSMWLDVRILFRTIFGGFLSKNAY